jgi:hypothetical protein
VDPVESAVVGIDLADGVRQRAPQRRLGAVVWCGHAITSPPWSAAS